MGKRGPKPQFTDVACPNHSCKSYGLTGEGNIVGNGTSVSRGEKVRKYICRHCGKVFNDHTGTFYYDLRKEESVIDLALKMAIKDPEPEGSCIRTLCFLSQHYTFLQFQLKAYRT